MIEYWGRLDIRTTVQYRCSVYTVSLPGSASAKNFITPGRLKSPNVRPSWKIVKLSKWSKRALRSRDIEVALSRRVVLWLANDFMPRWLIRCFRMDVVPPALVLISRAHFPHWASPGDIFFANSHTFDFSVLVPFVVTLSSSVSPVLPEWSIESSLSWLSWLVESTRGDADESDAAVVIDLFTGAFDVVAV